MESITSGMNFLKRRFSSQDSSDDKSPVAPTAQTHSTASNGFPLSTEFSFSNIVNKVSSTISAPSSPSKSGSSVYSQVQGITKNLMHAASGGISYSQMHRGNYKTILIIDDEPLDWNKYFRSNRTGQQLRIEQAPFWNIHVCCFAYKECTVEIRTEKERRVFHPDFVFFHQLTKSEKGDFSNIVFALLKAGIPTINSPESVVNFMNKSWMHWQLQQKGLTQNFQLIDQQYYPLFEHFDTTIKFPAVIRVGHGTKGCGKIKIDSEMQLLELEGIIRSFKGCEVTVEPFYETKYDLHLQKIGNEMKSFIRKGISNNWKSSASSAVLEQIAITNRHKQLIQTISEIFGGMDLVGVDILVAKDNREIIHDVNDILSLLGDTQEEDRKAIADLIQTKIMQIVNQNVGLKSEVAPPKKPEQPPVPLRPPPAAISTSTSVDQTRQPKMVAERTESQKKLRTEQIKEQPQHKPVRQQSVAEKGLVGQNSFQDDTMGQLKRTFAGIFGDV